MKLTLIATLIGLAFAAGSAHAATCAVPDAQPTVTIGHLPTTVPNVDVDGAGAGNCTLNDLILEEGSYADQAAWIAHVNAVLASVSAGSLSDAQKDEIRARAAAYDIKRYQRIKILGFNDFHGTLRSPGSLFGTPAGGIDYFAGYVAAMRAKNPTGTVIISAGDLIGASPLVSALFHDEGTIEAMNRLGPNYGLDFDAVGNHEFDEGKGELTRMQNGGCHPTDADHTCQGDIVGTPNPFEGAKFKFLSANVIDVAGQQTLFPSYQIKVINGTRVAFIGLVLKGTPTVVTPSGVEGLEFQDEADATNALIRQIRNKGAEVIVVSIHQGGSQGLAPSSIAGYNNCVGFTGDIVDIVQRLDPAVDLVISGHTHNVYNCRLPTRTGKLVPVTSALAFGRVVTEVDVTVDRTTRDAVAVAPWNTIVFRNNAAITPNATLNNLVAKYETITTPLANRVIGSIQGALPNTADAVGRQPAGFVIADSQLAATSKPGFGDAVVAFMNPGGVRNPGFTYPQSSANEGDGNVTYGEAFTVQPFGNSLVTMTLTGQQIKNVLEQQFRGCGTQNGNRIMQPSATLSYSFTPPAGWSNANTTLLNTACNWVDANSIMINGVVVDPSASYRVTVNNFMATGGDNYTEFKQGTNLLGGAVDIDALEAYLKAYGGPVPVPNFATQPRVSIVAPN
ncbi:MAG TPA: bifunctional metallophosphatase/5'-nucleotidase [Methyloversatilis sp.]